MSIPQWRHDLAHTAGRIKDALNHWRTVEIFHPNTPRDSLPSMPWIRSFIDGLKNNADLKAWGDAHIVKPLEALNATAPDALDSALSIIQRFDRLANLLRDGDSFDLLVWDDGVEPVKPPMQGTPSQLAKAIRQMGSAAKRTLEWSASHGGAFPGPFDLIPLPQPSPVPAMPGNAGAETTTAEHRTPIQRAVDALMGQPIHCDQRRDKPKARPAREHVAAAVVALLKAKGESATVGTVVKALAGWRLKDAERVESRNGNGPMRWRITAKRERKGNGPGTLTR